jgi:IS30 family transposase
MGYTHLTNEERYQLFIPEKAGHPLTFIAVQLGRHRSTIYRELNRNIVFDPRIVGYSPSRAHDLARSRITIRSYAKRISRHTWAAVEQCLRVRHSPEQISAALALEDGRHAELKGPGSNICLAPSSGRPKPHLHSGRRSAGRWGIGFLRGKET